jgi:hypothetical protein
VIAIVFLVNRINGHQGIIGRAVFDLLAISAEVHQAVMPLFGTATSAIAHINDG